jgi:hypothetical protein
MLSSVRVVSPLHFSTINSKKKAYTLTDTV